MDNQNSSSYANCNREEHTSERYSIWKSEKMRSEEKVGKPVYQREEVLQYIDPVDDYIQEYNRKTRNWEISFAFLFGSVMNPNAETVHDMDICIALQLKKAEHSYIGDAYIKEMMKIQNALHEICPMIELHRWETVASTVNDYQLMPALRTHINCDEGIQPYVFSGDIMLLGNKSALPTTGSVQIISVDQCKEFDSARVEFLLTFTTASLISIYRGIYMFIFSNGELERHCSLERILGFDMNKVFTSKELENSAKRLFESLHSNLLSDLESSVLARVDLPRVIAKNKLGKKG